MQRKSLHRWMIVTVAACPMLCSLERLSAANYTEQEPNDTKAGANVVPFPMVAGDTITGFTNGNFSFPGDSSPDYFLVQTAILPPGIYQHRLRLTPAGPPPATDQYSSSIVGLQQVNGVIQPNTEAAVHTQSQNGSYANHPGRTIQWYGFGRGERIYYRITGNNSTSSNYTATLTTTQVTPQVVDLPLDPGTITISNASTDTFTFFDAWVYNAGLNPIPGYGPNFPQSLSREFAAGTYYVALAKFDLGNNLPSPDGPVTASADHPNSPVLDFPNAVVVRATAFNSNISVNINGQYLPEDITGAPFNIVWLKLTVGGTGCTCAGDMDANSVFDGRDMPAFISSVLAGEGACADTNNDTLVNTDDIPSFITILLTGGPCA